MRFVPRHKTMKKSRKLEFSFTALFWGVVLILAGMFLFSTGILDDCFKKPQPEYSSQSSGENVIVETVIDESTYLAPQNSWYKDTVDKTSITKISIVPGMPKTPSVEAGETVVTWDASEEQNGRITCQVIGTELFIYTHGADKILLNVDASYTFSGFTSVTEIQGLEYIDTSETINMYWMFGDCDQLLEIKIPEEWDTSKVQNMSYMFYNCSGLKNADIKNMNTSAVTDMSYMFGFCSSLEFIDAEKWDLSMLETVATRSQMFMQAGSSNFTLKVKDNKMETWMRGDSTTALYNTMLSDTASFELVESLP